MGIAAFVVDSFTGRGIVSTSTDQALLGRLNMVLDGYRSFDVLASHARIDPARIAIMGFSRGGQSTLYSSLKRFQQMWDPRANFAAYIPLYASCSTTFIGDTDVSPAPIRQFHGLADDYVTIGPCRPYYERLRAAGRDAQLIEVPDAHHAFDNPLGPKTPTVAKGSQSTRGCTLKEEANGVIVINAQTGQPFTYKDPLRAGRSAHRLQRGRHHRDPQGGEGAAPHGVQAGVICWPDAPVRSPRGIGRLSWRAESWLSCLPHAL